MPDRLQGTDGIRREVRVSTHPSVSGFTPLDAFIKKNIITEEFCELYTYAYTCLLHRERDILEGARIVIGWDPRDKNGLFTKSAVRGVQKAGGRPLVAGMVPTPLVPLFLIERDAAGGIMITASHNPPDQNGIKLFVGGTGAKPLPFDDTRLTEEIFKTDCALLKELPLKYQEESVREDALEIFRNFSLDPLNSWIDDSCRFQKINIVVDPANGSFSKLAAVLFKEAGFAVTEVSADTGGEVNRDCGVVEFEGVRFIHFTETGRGGKFEESPVLREIFKKGHELNLQLKRGESKVAGAVFDADGDRFIRLDYDPFKEMVVVSSGDETAFFQASFLITRDPEKFRGACYINTVESDLNASIAAERLGYRTLLTGVGDKWLLLESLFLSLEAAPGFNKNVDDLRKRENISSIYMSELLNETPPAPENIRFAIGAEESGHAVTTGFLGTGDRIKPVFIGNGFKSAINSFVSTESLAREKTPEEYYRMIEEPFNPGYKKTLYVYYIKKDMLSSGSLFFKTLKSYAEELVRDLFGDNCQISLLKRPEEPDMLYFSVTSRESGLLRAGIYIRNSGTEDKTGINLRGRRADKAILDKAGGSLRDYLLARIKDPEKPDFNAERYVLEKIRERGRLVAKDLPDIMDEVNVSRVLKEIEKQELVKTTAGALELTKTGLQYIDRLREKYNESG